MANGSGRQEHTMNIMLSMLLQPNPHDLIFFLFIRCPILFILNPKPQKQTARSSQPEACLVGRQARSS
jgi:hypothetical protein